MSLGKRKVTTLFRFLKGCGFFFLLWAFDHVFGGKKILLMEEAKQFLVSHLSRPSNSVASPGLWKNVSVANKCISSEVTTVNPAVSHFRPKMVLNGAASQGTGVPANSFGNCSCENELLGEDRVWSEHLYTKNSQAQSCWENCSKNSTRSPLLWQPWQVPALKFPFNSRILLYFWVEKFNCCVLLSSSRWNINIWFLLLSRHISVPWLDWSFLYWV